MPALPFTQETPAHLTVMGTETEEGAAKEKEKNFILIHLLEILLVQIHLLA